MADITRINTFEQFTGKSSGLKPEISSASMAKKIGWFCTYTPEEIITAAGFIPFRITGDQKAKKAEGYFPINFCPFLKSSLEDLISISANREDFSGFVFTNSCDGMRRFYDVFKTYLNEIPSFLLDVPRIKTELSIKQFANNISGMCAFLSDIGGKKLELKALEESVNLHTEKRALLKKLDNFFKKSQDKIGINNYFSILKYAMTEEPEDFIIQLKRYLKSAEKDVNKNFSNKKTENHGPEVMLIGNFIDEANLWGILDELQCRIIATDLCSSERYFENITDRKELNSIFNKGSSRISAPCKNTGTAIEKILKDIAIRQLFKPQCMRMADLGKKIEEINKSISKNNIKGVIFISQKFCDNTLLFYPLLRQDLSKLNVPSLFLEIEHGNLSAGQIRTRIQAFLEIL